VTRRVAVLGGTGKTGRAVCRAVGPGAVPLGRAAWDDLPGALTGCDALYVIAPNMHPDEQAYVAAALEAARDAGVRRIVHHSVASPYLPAMPHHLGKARAEDVVRRSGVDWTVLQPGAYLQNFSWAGPPRIAYRADAPFGFVPDGRRADPCADDERLMILIARVGMLGIWKVEFRRGRAGPVRFARIRDNADDGESSRAAAGPVRIGWHAGNFQTLPHSAAGGPFAAGESLIHDHHGSRPGIVSPRKFPAAQDRDFHGPEIVGPNYTINRPGFFARRWRWAAGD